MPRIPLEPKIDKSLESLSEGFRPKAVKLISNLRARLCIQEVLVIVSETWRSRERQIWLYDSGRGRPGPILTHKDGVTEKSKHQSGDAIDVLLYRSGHVADGPLGNRAAQWKMIGEEAQKLGLRWGGGWGDSPHVEDIAKVENDLNKRGV